MSHLTKQKHLNLMKVQLAADDKGPHKSSEGGTRTPNLVINSHPLCRLSYLGMFASRGQRIGLIGNSGAYCRSTEGKCEHMAFRLGITVGFGLGYYLGTMAGRERYQQLNRLIRKVKGSNAYDQAADKAKAVVDLGTEKVKEGVQSKRHSNGKNDQQPNEFTPS